MARPGVTRPAHCVLLGWIDSHCVRCADSGWWPKQIKIAWSILYSVWSVKSGSLRSRSAHRDETGDELKSESRAHKSARPLQNIAFIYVCEADHYQLLGRSTAADIPPFLFFTLRHFHIISCIRRGRSLENSSLCLSVQIHGFLQVCGCDSSGVLITCVALTDSFAADFSVLMQLWAIFNHWG